MQNNSLSYKKTINKIEEKCKKLVKESAVPGLSVALFSREKIIWMKGFGFTDRKKTREVDENIHEDRRFLWCVSSHYDSMQACLLGTLLKQVHAQLL